MKLNCSDYRKLGGLVTFEWPLFQTIISVEVTYGNSLLCHQFFLYSELFAENFLRYNRCINLHI